MLGSIQDKLGRVRPPRVQITYDVETGGALEKKEIPFVVGIIAPLSGKSTKPQVPLVEKKMVYIDRDNFNKVLDSIQPRVAFEIPNTLPEQSGKLMVSVDFNNIEEFNPIEVVKKVPDLNKLYGERCRLRDFLAKLDGNQPLNSLLIAALSDSETRNAINLLTTSADANLQAARALNDDKLRSKATTDLFNKPLKAAADEKVAVVARAVINKWLSDGKIILTDSQKPYALDIIFQYIAMQMAEGNDSESALHTLLTDIDAAAEINKKALAAQTTAADKLKKEQEKDTPDPAAMKTAADTLAAADQTLDDAEQVLIKLKGKFNVAGTLSLNISRRDAIISRQLNYIIHHPDFQKMEASWQGLYFLVMNTETSSKLKLRLLNATKDEIYKDLDKAVEFDQSALFKLIYEQEYGTYGGEPYSVLIGDYEFGRGATDIRFLELISGVAAAAHAPFIASAWAKLFDMEDFGNLYKPRDLSKIFESAELIQWQAFRESEDSRYVSLTLPKVMLRLPYHHENNPIEGIYFDEDVAITEYLVDEDGQAILDSNGEKSPVTKKVNGVNVEKSKKRVDASKILWGNPAYVLAQRITNAFSLYGWTAAIRGVEGGGLVEGLPAYTFETEDGDIELNCPTQVSITDRREKELNDLGFMAICHCKGFNKAAFFGGQTTNSPKMYLTDSATANANISAMLPYIMAASRFAHYIKVLMREKIGSFMTRQNVNDYLNTWIAQWVLLDDSAPQHIKAKYPLREAMIEVSDIAGKPGAYKATIFLRPHFQLEELNTSIRLVAELPS